jgi:hypothetical protein
MEYPTKDGLNFPSLILGLYLTLLLKTELMMLLASLSLMLKLVTSVPLLLGLTTFLSFTLLLSGAQ